MYRVTFTKKIDVNSIEPIKPIEDFVEEISEYIYNKKPKSVRALLDIKFPDGYFRDGSNMMSNETAEKYIRFKYEIEGFLI